MADPIYTSASPIAVNPANGELIGGATFTVHAPDDTSFSTPLAVTDPNTGVAINPLRSNSNGTLPAFKVAGDLPRVKLKSGAFVTELVSLDGLVAEQITNAGLDSATVSAAIAAAGTATTKAGEASASAQTAADAATLASQKASAVAEVVATNDGIMSNVLDTPGTVFGGKVDQRVIDGVADAVPDALAADPTIRTAASAAAATAVDAAVAGKKIIEEQIYFPPDAAGGFVGENGRATDLLVDSGGNVLPDTINRWAPRIGAAGGFIDGAVGSPWYGGGLVGENGRATELVIDANGNVPDDVLARWASRMSIAPTEHTIMSGPDLAFVGDSLTAGGAMASKVAALTGRTARNLGVGGETTTTILARMGVWPFLITPSGGQIPTSGSVDVTFVSSYHTPGSSIWPLLQGSGVREGDTYLWGTIAGVRVRLSIRVKDPAQDYPLHGAGDVYQITRDGTGAAVAITRPTPFIPEYGPARLGDIIIAWMGQNGPTDDATFAGFQALDQSLTKAGKRFLFMTAPGVANTGWTDLEKRMLDRWGRRFCNVRRFLIDDALMLMGLTPTSTDLDDIAAGRVPTQLRTDSVHHTPAAQQAIAEFLIYPRLKELRYI